MPEFPPAGKTAVKAAMEELGYTAERAQKIDEIDQTVKATWVAVGPITGELEITADDQEFTLIDTSQIAKVANTPHGLMGWMDASAFQQIGQTNPNATLKVKWYVDGKLYTEATFTPEDFDVEQILYFLERRAIRYHKITITVSGTGATTDNPLKLPYSFTLTAGLLPIPP